MEEVIVWKFNLVSLAITVVTFDGAFSLSIFNNNPPILFASSGEFMLESLEHEEKNNMEKIIDKITLDFISPPI
jgi:hypothetical protein